MNAITRMGRCVWVLGLFVGSFAQAQSLVGRTSGEPGVSVTGSARYSIPLAVPPGTNGLAPKLAIAYDSRDGNGLLGVGFRLAGLSQIERCPGTIAQDGALRPVSMDRGDRFCLDGKRLRLTTGTYGYAGSQYQTEVEEFSRITALGTSGDAPASFQLEARDGLVYEYGTTADSRVDAAGVAVPRAWALSRIRDRSGNTVEFWYAEDSANGSHRPARIDYTGNASAGTLPYYSVRFVYEPRPSNEVLAGYVAGSPVVEYQRLGRIDVVHVATGALVRRFELAYEASTGSGRSRLSSLRECGTTECLPATAFTWHTFSPGWSLWESGTGIAPSGTSSPIPGDVDGDGCEDLLYFSKATLEWLLLRGSLYGYAGPSVRVTSGGISTDEAVSVDLDADGKRDLLLPVTDSRYATTWAWLHHTSGTSYVRTPTGLAVVAPTGGTVAADIDGDGREDLVYVKNKSASIFWRRNLTSGGVPSFAAEAVLWTSPYGAALPSAPAGTQPQRFRSVVRQGDFNADGRADFLLLQQSATRIEWHALFSTGVALQTRAIVDNAVAMPNLGDFNGDGLTDLAYPVTVADGSTAWCLRFSTGAAPATAAKFTTEAVTPAVASAATTIVTDWNGDGRADLLDAGTDGSWQYCPATGVNLDACRSVGFWVSGMTGLPIVTDANGDGVPDVLYAADEWRYRPHAVQYEVLSAATDGLGNYTRYTYTPTTDERTYTRASGSVFPVRELASPLTVVSYVTRSDGIGGSYLTWFTYEGARQHLQGRGFLGFARRTATDARAGLARVEEYAQDPGNFELLGLPTTVTLRQASGSPLVREAYTWSRYDYGAGFDTRRFPFPSAVVADRYELDGARVTTSSTRNTYDSFGTLTDQSTTVTEVSRGSNPGAQHLYRTILSGVVNDTANWCLGRPSSIVERRSHTLAGGTELARSAAQSWDFARCRATQDVVEPGSTTLRVTTDYSYDAWGNRAAQTVTPAGQAGRRTGYAWTENGRFLGSVENAAGHVTAFTWDAITAQRIQARDPNGSVTRWSYDGLNRVTRESAPDGTSVVVKRWLCGANDCAWPGARYAMSRVRRGVADAYIATDVLGLDTLDRPVYLQHELPGGTHALEVRRYDNRGQLAQQSLRASCCASPSNWVSYAYDVLGRRTAEQRPAGDGDPTVAATRWTYDGLNVVTTDALSRTTVHRLDAVGHALQVVDQAGADTDYEYDAFGNLLKVRDFAGNETALTYNVRGFRTAVVDPDAGRWTYDYSPLGELRSQTNARGQATTYAYDSLGRPTSRVEPEGTTSWTWGSSASAANVGALESVSSPGLQETYGYDYLGRPASITRAVGGQLLVTRLSYDGTNGLLDTLTYPAPTGVAPLRLKHGYDRGRLVRLADADNPSNAFWTLDAVNPQGAASIVTQGNGVRIASTYDAVTGLLVARTAGLSSSNPYQSLQYTWDAVGNLTGRSDVGRGVLEQFFYDPRDRLDYVLRSGVTVLDLAYDDVGNITFKSDIGDYRYDATRRHAVVAAGANKYGYDANGAMTSANGTAFAWYSYDLPSQLTHANGNYSAFYYGPDRARYRQVARAGTSLTETLYAMGGLYERSSRDGTVTERSYIAAEGELVAVRTRVGASLPQTVYLLKDHLGGVEGYTSETGALLAKTSYHPMGARRSGDWLSPNPTSAEWQQIQLATPRGYTEHEHLDNLGLIHMNGRVYDPVLGRFLSPDPVIQDPYDSQSLNRYSYVRNNPLRFTDPSGLCRIGHPAGDQLVANCLENVMFQYWNLSSLAQERIFANAAQAQLAANVAQAGSVNGGVDPAMEQVVVTAPRHEPSDMFAVDATLYAQHPQWLTAFVTSELGRSLLLAGLTTLAVLDPSPVEEAVLAGGLMSESRALSTIRYTRPGETFFRYESNNPAFSRVTRSGGLRSGTYAAPVSDGLIPLSGRASVYNLPDPMILRTESFVLRPPPNTLIIGPKPVMGGTGNEVIFPFGYGP
jgi:RHS repeat-associated protein